MFRLPLASVQIAAPCTAAWEEMTGDARVRFCAQCEKHVYNLSEMTTAEAEDLLDAHGENVCVRFYQRADGTVMTTDCPVGVSKRRRRRVAATAVALAASAAGAAAATWSALTGVTAMPPVDTSLPAPAPVTETVPPPVIETPPPQPVKPPPHRVLQGKPIRHPLTDDDQ